MISARNSAKSSTPTCTAMIKRTGEKNPDRTNLSKLYVEFNEQAKINPQLDNEAARHFPRTRTRQSRVRRALDMDPRGTVCKDYMKVYELLERRVRFLQRRSLLQRQDASRSSTNSRPKAS
ncbi:MAG: hypothetical protein MZU97_00720 [Bacillus subtilis]|nr:hypothetical protein [Bacillus subtilis]